PPDALACQVDREQRRRACRVDGETRSVYVQEVRHPVGDRPIRGGRTSELPLGPTRCRELTVGAIHGTDEHAGVRLACVLTEITRLLQQVPCGFQEQPFLWIDVLRVARQDTEEPGIELVDALEEPAPP